MALVKCPDCGRDVSSEAPACPGCGRPMKSEAPPIAAPPPVASPVAPPPKKMSGFKKGCLYVGGAVVALFLVVGLLPTMLRGCGSPPPAATPQPTPAPASISAQTAGAKAAAKMAKTAAANEVAGQKVYFDAVKLAKLSKTDAVAMFKKNPVWAKVTVDRDGIILRDAEAAKADGDGGFQGQGTHCSVTYDHGRLLSAWLTFQERPPDEDKLLAFVGITGAPSPTKIDDPRLDERRTGSGLKAFGSVRFEWAGGFGPFKRVSTVTRLPETDPSLCPTCVISRVDVEYVPHAVIERWLSN